MEDQKGEFPLKNLGIYGYEALNEEEALNLFILGNMKWITSDTPLNQASSRSHAIFTILVEAKNLETEEVTTSKLQRIDLAGSKRL